MVKWLIKMVANQIFIDCFRVSKSECFACLTWDWVTVSVHKIPAVASDLTIAISNNINSRSF